MKNENVVVKKVVEDLDAVVPAKLLPSSQPTPEFIEAVNRIEAKKLEQAVAPIHNPLPEIAKPVTKLPPIEHIPVLEYKWKGMCPVCINPVETIMVSTEKTLHAICYCVFCKRTIDDIKVHPILRKEVDHGNNVVEKRVSSQKKV